MTTDSPEKTPVSDLARKAVRLMSQGGAMRVTDIPGDSSLSSHTFGGDVSRAVADLCRPDRSPAGEGLAIAVTQAMDFFRHHGFGDMQDKMAAALAAYEESQK